MKRVVLYFLFCGAISSFYMRPIAAQVAQDERALSALDRAVEFYGQQPSFSIRGRETLSLDDEVLRRTSFEFDAQIPKRAALRVITIDADNKPIGLVNARLVGADSYSIVVSEQPEKQSPIRESAERSAAFTDLINSVPSLGLTVAAFAFKTNPARTSSLVNARFTLGADGEEVVTAQSSLAGESVVVNAEYFLDGRSGALKKLRTRTQINGKTVTILTEFDRPISNWKGSQAATDAAVYNRGKLAPLAEAETEAAQQMGHTLVEPAARAIFERSAKFYKSLDGLHVEWTQTEASEFGEEKTQSTFDYERAGRLRLEHSTLYSSLMVIDGQSQWTLESKFLNLDGPLGYQRKVLSENTKNNFVFTGLLLFSDLPESFKDLLNRLDWHPFNPFIRSSAAKVEGFISFEGSVLESQQWNGETCDLVQTLDVSRSDDQTTQKRDVQQLVYWFARSNGRLMRLQNGFRSGDGAGSTTDSQVTKQTFNPTFAPDIFKFVPPANAVLKTE